MTKSIEAIRERLKQNYHNGTTFMKMSQDSGLSYSYVRGLVKGTKKVEGITVENLFKLFPKAEIALDGFNSTATVEDSNSQQNPVSTGGGNQIVAKGIVRGNVSINQGTSGIPKDVLTAIVADAEMSPADKAAILRDLIRG